MYICSRKREVCEATAAEVNAVIQRARVPGSGRLVVLPPLDLAKHGSIGKQMTALLGAIAAHQGRSEPLLHGVVNNSGITWGQPAEAYDPRGFARVMTVNVEGLYYVTMACLPALRAAANDKSPATVVNIGSVLGIGVSLAPTYAYDASKAAVHSLTRKLARLLGPEKITVNAIAPGLVPTDMSKGLEKYSDPDSLYCSSPLGRPGDHDAMAGAIKYLLSSAGAWVTGVVLPVDGGALLNASL